MELPGPWFISKKSKYGVISAFHPSGVGKYASQLPQREHGGYSVASCATEELARDIARYPEILRAYEIARDMILGNAEMKALAERYYGPQLAILTNVVPVEDEMPRAYKMSGNRWEEALDALDQDDFRERLQHYKWHHLLDCFTEWWDNHPFGKHFEFWQ